MGQLFYCNNVISRGRPNEVLPGTLIEIPKGEWRDFLLANEIIRPADEAEIALHEKIEASKPKPAKAAEPTAPAAAAAAPAKGKGKAAKPAPAPEPEQTEGADGEQTDDDAAVATDDLVG